MPGLLFHRHWSLGYMRLSFYRTAEYKFRLDVPIKLLYSSLNQRNINETKIQIGREI